jgi:two-component system response regulator YesN
MVYRLMIVDDERLIRQGLRKVIPWEDLGFKVVAEANSGKAALETAMITGKEPQVILTDIKMPDMSGLELISRLHARFPKLRSVVISGYSDFKYAVEALKLKVEDYILKPIDPEAIKKTFARLHHVLDSEEEERGRTTHTYPAELNTLIESLEESLETGKDIKDLARSMVNQAERTMPNPPSCYRQILGDLVLRFQIADFVPGPQAGNVPPEILFLQSLEDLALRIREQGASMGKLLTLKIKRAVEDHYGESDLSLGKLADLLKVSYGYLSTVFSKNEQMGFSVYLRRYRMKKARELLLSRDFKIYEVALRVGYGNTHYFSDAFHKEYGLSPRAYIARMGGDRDGS